MMRVMKLPVPVKGSRMWTPESERDLPNSVWRISVSFRQACVDQKQYPWATQ
jgi:hypothetical protein